MNDFNVATIAQTRHRPWPKPNGPWMMRQTWHDLLFAHWAVDPLRLRSLVPESLTLDCFAGRAWIGIVPFQMTNVALRGTPNIPGLSAFAELNVRTYVTVANRPGVYFFSLDAASQTAVFAARTFLQLPYHAASIQFDADQQWRGFNSRRKSHARAVFSARYRPVGAGSNPQPGSLEYFLTERYCLYNVDDHGPYKIDIHHAPWDLQPAEGYIGECTVADASDLRIPDGSPLLHYARRQDMVAWPPERIGAAESVSESLDLVLPLSRSTPRVEQYPLTRWQRA